MRVCLPKTAAATTATTTTFPFGFRKQVWMCNALLLLTMNIDENKNIHDLFDDLAALQSSTQDIRFNMISLGSRISTREGDMIALHASKLRSIENEISKQSAEILKLIKDINKYRKQWGDEPYALPEQH